MNKNKTAKESLAYSETDEFMGIYKEPPTNRIPNIHYGDQVIMTNKYDVPNEIKGRIFTVISAPQYENGTRRVKLDGYKGSYPVDGLKIVG